MSNSVFLLVGASTITWYWASSISAVASQKVVGECNSLEECSATIEMTTLTCVQLLLGAIICNPFVVSKIGSMEPVDPKKNLLSSLQRPFGRTDFFLGALHFAGCLCTNMGYAYGSASLVQVVKMLEPIETLFLTAVVSAVFDRSKSTVLTLRKVLAVLLICAGTITIVSQKKAMQPNPKSIMFALASGLLMSSRNVAKKTFSPGKSPRQEEGAMEKIKAGLGTFWRITTSSCMFGLAILMATVVHNGASMSIIGSILGTKQGIKASLFHGFYNMASITVLGLVSAPTHSLLNAGKRISNVIVAAIIFGVPLGLHGILGLVVAAFGALLYTNVHLPTPTRPPICTANVTLLVGSTFWLAYTSQKASERILDLASTNVSIGDSSNSVDHFNLTIPE